MYGSPVTGERRIDELTARYGVAQVRTYMRELQKYSERRMRAAVREIPNGVYEASIQADDDGVSAKPYLIKLRMLVLDEDVVLDFRGVRLRRTVRSTVPTALRCPPARMLCSAPQITPFRTIRARFGRFI
jgi:N-methylhydantoinase B